MYPNVIELYMIMLQKEVRSIGMEKEMKKKWHIAIGAVAAFLLLVVMLVFSFPTPRLT